MNSYSTFNREWVIRTAKLNRLKYPGRDTERHPPFNPYDFSVKYQLGAGAEQMVYAFPSYSKYRHIVIKESRKSLPARVTSLSRILVPNGSLGRILNWREIAQIKFYDNRIISGIMGQYALPSTYVHGYASDGSGNRVNYCIQRKVTTHSLSAVLQDDPEAINLRPELRNDLLKIVWGSRKVLLELGATPDFYNGQNILFTEGQRPVLNDTGFPSLLANMSAATDLPIPIRLYCISIIDFHLNFLLSLERRLHATSEEISCLSSDFRVSPRAYTEQVISIKRARKELEHRVPFGGQAAKLYSLLRKI